MDSSLSLRDIGFEEKRRTLKDRRQKPTRPISRYMFSGRRQSIRREEDRKTLLYVDRYGHKLFFALLLIMALCVLDVYFTILHLEHGAEEINPLMNLLIGQGYMKFFLVKYSLTALAALVLCMHKNLRLVRIGISSILIFYFALSLYDLLAFLLVLDHFL